MNLWRQMIGDPDYVPPDLTWVWPVQLGSVTEEVNLRFYGHNTGNSLSRHGEVVVNVYNDWASCTLDAWDDAELRERTQTRSIDSKKRSDGLDCCALATQQRVLQHDPRWCAIELRLDLHCHLQADIIFSRTTSSPGI